MEAAVAISLWLLKTAVIPDAHSRLVDAVSNRTHVKRLQTAVRRDTGLRPGRRYRRWLRTEQTWDDLVARNQEAYDNLLETLAAAEAEPRFRRRPRNRVRARALVDSTIAFFLPTLDPSTAIAVSDFRAERRHVEVMTRLDATSSFDERLAMLPPAAAATLVRAGSCRGMAERVVDAMVTGQPRELITRWTESRPEWLRDAPAIIVLSLAELAQAYGLRRQAGLLFEESADLGLDSATWYARAAFEAQACDEPDRRDDLLKKAHAAGDGHYVQVLEAAIAEDGAAVLELLGPNDAVKEPFIGLLYAIAVGQRDAEAQISFLRTLVDQHPAYSTGAIVLAQLLLERSMKASSTSRELDREDALDLAVAAIDARRAWRGDAGPAVELACQAALISSDFIRVIEIGTVPPDGEAWPEEAAHPDVQFSVAQAALALGKHDLVERLATSGGRGVHQALLNAEILVRREAPPAEIAAQYELAWELTSTENDKMAVWMGASMHGVEPLPGAEELQRRDDDLPLLCSASQHIATGRLDQAIDLLRPRRTSEAMRRLLTDAYLRQGDIDSAVSELLDAAQRFANLDHQVRAIEILIGADRISEAAELADSTLTLLSPKRPERNLLHEVGVAAAHNRQAWQNMESRTRAWITEFGADRRRRWLLIMAIYNQADPARAWQVLQEGGDDFAPVQAIEAQLWIALNGRFNASPAILSEILRLADRFPDDSDVRDVAVNTFFLVGDKKGPIEPDELAHWHELIRDRSDNPSQHDTFITISVPDDPEGLIDAFRPLLEQQAQAVNTWLRKLRHELWPYGALSMVAGRGYTKTFAQRPNGYLPIATADRAVAAAELEAATTAIEDGRIVVDLSSVVVGSYIPERWPDFVGAFTTVCVTASSRHDATLAADDFHPRSNETLAWDVATGRPVLHTMDDDVAERLQAQLTWVRDQVASLSIFQPTTTEETKPGEDLGPWMDTVHAARASALPMWADDVGLRALARNEGVAAFGSDSLLSALRARGKLTEDSMTAAIETLRERYCVDLPVDEDWIARTAARDDYTPGPALLALSRGPVWANPRAAFDLWSDIAAAAAMSDAAADSPWVYAAVTGISSAHRDVHQATQLNAAVLVQAATLHTSEPDAFAKCAAAAEAAATEAGLPDPTELALAMIFELLTQQHGISGSATAIARLGSQLVDHHREALRRILFDTPDH